MSGRQRKLTIILVATAFVALLAFYRQWLIGRPAWLLTARNTDDGVLIEFFKERENQPTYVLLLENHQIPRDVEKVARTDLPPDVGITTFHDETFKPGRWTLELAGVKLDVMESRLVLEDGTNLFPAEQRNR